jgi:hypothetical protein
LLPGAVKLVSGAVPVMSQPGTVSDGQVNTLSRVLITVELA